MGIVRAYARLHALTPVGDGTMLPVWMGLLLAELGHPQCLAPAIHVAGTKGKGSTAAMIASTLQVAGHRVGFYSSPSLHDARERIRINGEPIATDELFALAERVRLAVERTMARRPNRIPSSFEVNTAMAFLYFAERGVRYQVIEAGLGGLRDTTNVLRPLVSVITSISFDHMEVLGSTIEEIATHKAGIIKRGIPAISAPRSRKAKRHS